jgi:hypothetical protein
MAKVGRSGSDRIFKVKRFYENREEDEQQYGHRGTLGKAVVFRFFAPGIFFASYEDDYGACG